MQNNVVPNKCATDCLSIDEVWRRAGGRRAYNRMRQFRANFRLLKSTKLLHQTGLTVDVRHGLLKQRGVSRSNVCCDFRRLRRRAMFGLESDKFARGLALAPNTPAITRRRIGSTWQGRRPHPRTT